MDRRQNQGIQVNQIHLHLMEILSGYLDNYRYHLPVRWSVEELY